MSRLLRFSTVVVVCLAVSLPLFAAPKSSVKIINQSKWEIHHLYVSPASEEQWGPDQLEDRIIARGETFLLRNIPCDTYDVKVVDEDGDECIIEAVDLCGEAAYWKITDKELLECEGYE